MKWILSALLAGACRTPLNYPPHADGGGDVMAVVGDTVVLDGSASFDPDGRTVDLQWSLVSQPPGSSVHLAEPTSVNPSLRVTAEGAYVLTLVVQDTDGAHSQPDTVVVRTFAEDMPPVAVLDFSSDTGVPRVESMLTFDASGSFDREGGELSYAFSVVMAPEGATAEISQGEDPAFATLVPDAMGTWIVGVAVSDGQREGTRDDVVLDVGPRLNDPPDCDAGASQVLTLGSSTTLDATGTTDPDGDELSYTWTPVFAPAGSTAALSDPATATPAFTPDLTGRYAFEVEVCDYELCCHARTELVVERGNEPPTCNAGSNVLVEVGTRATVDAGGSWDADGDPLTFSWSILAAPASSSATLSTAGPEAYLVPDVEGRWQLQVEVCDAGSCCTDFTYVSAVEPNTCPTVNAGSDQTFDLGGVANLSATASDPDGDYLNYGWVLVSAPAGSAASVVSPTSPSTTLTPDAVGTYTLAVGVTDGECVEYDSLLVVVTPDNDPPSCDAGSDDSASLGDTVTLDGSGTSDPDGDSLTYNWNFLSRPSGSSATLLGTTTQTPRFEPDVEGSYVVELYVSDGVDTCSDTVTIRASNVPPICDAGSDDSADVGERYRLDSSGTYDPNGDPVSTSWAILSAPSGGSGDLSGSVLTPSVKGTYVLQLTGDDGTDTCTDTVTITVANRAPTCSAGSDVSADQGATATLSGSASDADGDALSWAWSISSRPGGSTAALADSGTSTPDLVPDARGTWVVQLVVSDGTDSCTDSATLTGNNAAPVCDAGSDQTVEAGDSVTLDSSGTTDPDGDGLSRSWSLVSSPAGSSPTLGRTTLLTDIKGSYVVRLTATDGTDSCTDTMTVTANNQEPLCDAGRDQAVLVGEAATLSGAGTVDPDGDALSFSWVLAAAPAGSSAGLGSATGSGTTLVPDVRGTYTVRMTATDGEDGCSDTVVVTAPNQAPTCSAGGDVAVDQGTVASLSGSASDPEGDALTWAWSITSAPSGSSASLIGGSTSSPSLRPDVKGDWVVELSVSDGDEECTDTVVVTGNNLAPSCDAGPDQTIGGGQSATLDSSGSSDPDGDPLSTSWSLVSAPAGSTATVSGSQLDTDIKGTYVVELVATDGEDSCTDTVTVTANNQGPTCDAGDDVGLQVGETATLDSSGSFDPDGDALAFTWTLESRPAASSAGLGSASGDTTTLVPDVGGTYIIRVDGTDGDSVCTDTAVVSADNQAPTCDAGPDSDIDLGDSATLDATGSSDPDGDPLSFTWTLLSGPGDDGLSDEGSDLATATPDATGVYVFQVQVSDGALSCTDEVLVSVSNRAPSCDAGLDQLLHAGESAVLDGSASADPDGDTLTALWTLLSSPGGSVAAIDDDGEILTGFTPDALGDYVVELTLSDGVDSCSDTLTITVDNTAPSCDAGGDQVLHIGESAVLDGSGSSDPDGDGLTAQWALLSSPGGSTASIDDDTTLSTGFTPDELGDYRIELTVSDGWDSCTDSLVVSVENEAPTCDAGADQDLDFGDTAALSGSASDGDGDALSTTWSVSSAPAGSSASPSSPGSLSSAFSPDAQGTFVLLLTVTDGYLVCTDSVAVSVANAAPLCDAGGDLSGTVGVAAEFDGTGSSDPDGDALSYRWTLLSSPSGSSAVLRDTTTSTPAIIPDEQGEYEVELTLSDGEDSCTDVAILTVGNKAPNCTAGADHHAFLGDTVDITGVASDSDGDALSYSWEISSGPSGSSAALGSTTTTATDITPDVEGTYVLLFTVSDGIDTCSDSTNVVAESVNSAPVADAGGSQEVEAEETVTLDGSGSYDADGDALTWSWTLVKPADSTTSLSSSSATSPTFVADVPGFYIAVLVVDDGEDSDSDIALINVTGGNRAPVVYAGENQSIILGETAEPDGSESYDPEGDDVTWSWRFISVPRDSALDSTDIVDRDTLTPTFTPDVKGEYILTLEGNDGGGMGSDSVIITAYVDGDNAPPVAVAPDSFRVDFGEVAELDGSASYDPDGDALTYEWTFVRVPDDSSLTDADFVDGDTAYASFTPDVEDGVFVIMLTVSDGIDSNSDQLHVMSLSSNEHPHADTGGNQVVSVGDTVTLDGSGTTDPDGDAITYSWTLVRPAGSSATLSSTSAESPTFVADVAGRYEVILIASDGSAQSWAMATITAE